MANKVNNWKEVLDLANKDLIQQQVYIDVSSNGDGTYNIAIVDNSKAECYAEGYYEDKLGDCINDAWAHAKAKVKPQMAYRVSAYYDLGAEDEILIEIYENEELAKQRVAQLINKWKDGWHYTEEDADEWTEKEDSLYAWKDSEWNVNIFWMPEPIRNKIE